MNYSQLGKDIVENIGGKNNVISLIHCATRLRFKLKDISEINREKIEKLDGIIKVVESGGQFQVIIGNSVGKVYAEIIKIINIDKNPMETEITDKNIVNRAIDIITAIFTPLFGVLAGAGVLKGLIAIFLSLQIIDKSSGTYSILFAASDSLFYFMPLIVAFTTAKKFGANEILSVSIVGATIYPGVINIAHTGMNVTFLAIPVTLTSYGYTILPAIIAVWILSIFEKFCNKVIHENVKGILSPLICITLTVPLIFIVFGPIGNFISNIIGNMYTSIYSLSPILIGALVGGMWQVAVMFGIHWGIVPVMLNNISKYKMDTLTPLLGPANFSQGGAVLGVYLKTKNKKLKSISSSAAVAASFGITEPAIYGATLTLKKPFICACIGGAVGGAITGYFHSAAVAFVSPGLLSIPALYGNGFNGAIIGMITSYILSAMLTYIVGFDDPVEEINQKSQNEVLKTKEIIKNEKILSPLSGFVKSLSDVSDEVFASGALGKGIAIEPLKGRLVSPVDGVATIVFPTGHAVGITTDSGAEILIHIGFDTVKLNGQYFKSNIKQGESITKGQLLVEFDIDKIKEEGFDTTTAIVITNWDKYSNIVEKEISTISTSDELLELYVEK